jgi:hypothetical protein
VTPICAEQEIAELKASQSTLQQQLELAHAQTAQLERKLEQSKQQSMLHGIDGADSTVPFGHRADDEDSLDDRVTDFSLYENWLIRLFFFWTKFDLSSMQEGKTHSIRA